MSVPNLNMDIFGSSIQVNTLFYLLIYTLCLLLSKSYIVAFVRTMPMKQLSKNFFLFSLIQSFIGLVPCLVLNLFLYTQDSSSIPKVNTTYILFSFGFSLSSIARFLGKRVKIGPEAISYMIIICVITTTSCLFSIFGIYSFINLILLVLASVCIYSQVYLDNVQEQENVTFNNSIHSMQTALGYVLFPFEIVFENIFPLSEHRQKSYSLNIFSKLAISPLFLSLLLVKFTEKGYSLASVSYAAVFSALLSIVLFCVYIKFGYSLPIKIYSVSAMTTVFFILLKQSFSISTSISDTISVPLDKITAILLGLIAAIPTISIYKHFAAIGYVKRSLFSLFYYCFLGLFLHNFIYTATKYDLKHLNSLRTAFGGIFSVQFLIIWHLLQKSNTIDNTLFYLGVYVCIQEVFLKIKGSLFN